MFIHIYTIGFTTESLSEIILELFPAVARSHLAVGKPWPPFPKATLRMVNQLFHQSCGHGMRRSRWDPDDNWLVVEPPIQKIGKKWITISRIHVKAANQTSRYRKINWPKVTGSLELKNIFFSIIALSQWRWLTIPFHCLCFCKPCKLTSQMISLLFRFAGCDLNGCYFMVLQCLWMQSGWHCLSWNQNSLATSLWTSDHCHLLLRNRRVRESAAPQHPNGQPDTATVNLYINHCAPSRNNDSAEIQTYAVPIIKKIC